MKLIGINDEQTVCDCCGKTDLKRTVIVLNDCGDTQRLGTSCAARALNSASMVGGSWNGAKVATRARKNWAEAQFRKMFG